MKYAFCLIVATLASLTSAYYAITGAPGSGVFPRREIRSLFFNYRTQWNLYLLALQSFQADPPNNLTSYYQIGGIHGLPNIPWDGVAQTSSGVGYCVHSSNLFPTWHRPYLALFEQQVVQRAQSIATQYPTSVRDQYTAAAATLRIPYWDWAVQPAPGRHSLPNIMTAARVSVDSPEGPKTINNPLFRYNYPGVKPNFAAPWSTWNYTLRWPSSGASTAVSQENLATAAVDNNAANQRSSLYQWFTACPNYLEMSNDEQGTSSAGCHTSLESLHNNIHVWTGGTVSPQGHMTIVPYSAVDPLFMLHHAQIDRLFAMWQAIYPNSYVTPQISNVNTFTIAKGSVQGPDSPLTPFHSDAAGNFWTSNLNGGGTKSAMMASVNQLYGPSATQHAKRKRTIDTPLRADNGSSFEYIANVATSRFALDGSYMVYLFFREPTNQDTSSWAYDPNIVGSYGVFAQSGMVASNVVSTGSIPLTISLTAKVASGELTGLSESCVVPFLKSRLVWKIVGPDGVELNPASVPRFKIAVVASTLQPPSSPDEFPTWSPFITLAEVTKGKAGGHHQYAYGS